MGADGWSVEPGPGVVPDPIHGARHLREVYLAADRRYTGRVTVPVLWDRETATVVSNESADILRMFNAAFDGVGARPGDYWPEAPREEIDSVKPRVYDTVKKGAYHTGFHTTPHTPEGGVGQRFWK